MADEQDFDWVLALLAKLLDRFVVVARAVESSRAADLVADRSRWRDDDDAVHSFLEIGLDGIYEDLLYVSGTWIYDALAERKGVAPPMEALAAIQWLWRTLREIETEKRGAFYSDDQGGTRFVEGPSAHPRVQHPIAPAHMSSLESALDLLRLASGGTADPDAERRRVIPAVDAEFGPVKLYGPNFPAQVGGEWMPRWRSQEAFAVVRTLVDAKGAGMKLDKLRKISNCVSAEVRLAETRASHPNWAAAIHMSGKTKQGYYINETMSIGTPSE